MITGGDSWSHMGEEIGHSFSNTIFVCILIMNMTRIISPNSTEIHQHKINCMYIKCILWWILTYRHTQWNRHNNWDNKNIHHPQSLHVYRCTHPTCLSVFLISISRQLQACFLCWQINLNFIEFYRIYRILCKWSHRVCTLIVWLLYSLIILNFILVVLSFLWLSLLFILFYGSVIYHYKNVL